MTSDQDASFFLMHCANLGCEAVADKTCARCSLVAYCDRTCQEAHWLLHKMDCTAALSKKTWTPRTHRKGLPQKSELSQDPLLLVNEKGRRVFLWGNTQAVDILNLPANEGIEYEEDLDICFAASGDWRNMIKTVVAIPYTFKNKLKILMNDFEEDIVFRNVILLLLMGAENTKLCVDTAIHLWYSARLTLEHVLMLDEYVRPAILDIVTKIRNKSDTILLSKTFAIGDSSLKVMLYKHQWQKFLNLLEKKYTCKEAEQARQLVVLAPGPLDVLDIIMFKYRRNLHRRNAIEQFRTRGVLLPFGYHDKEFCEANPTLLDAKHRWTQHFGADPLNGWSREDLEACESKPLKGMRNDIYGNLYFLLKTLLIKFHGRVRSSCIYFEMTSLDAVDLPNMGMRYRFDRLEIQSILDGEDEGRINKTLAMAAKMLNPTNEKATLIALFETWALGMIERHGTSNWEECKLRAGTYLGYTGELSHCPWLPGSESPFQAMVRRAADYFHPFDNWFHEYYKLYGFPTKVASTGLIKKEMPTIMSQMPFLLTKQPGELGSQEEFDNLHESIRFGCERYVEYQLVQFTIRFLQKMGGMKRTDITAVSIDAP